MNYNTNENCVYSNVCLECGFTCPCALQGKKLNEEIYERKQIKYQEAYEEYEKEEYEAYLEYAYNAD